MGGRGTRAGMDKAERFGSSDLDIEQRRYPPPSGGAQQESTARQLAARPGRSQARWPPRFCPTWTPLYFPLQLRGGASRRHFSIMYVFSIVSNNILGAMLPHKVAVSPQPTSYCLVVFSPNAQDWIWSLVFWFYSLAEDSQWLLARIAQVECRILSHNQVYVHMIAWISCLCVCNDS